MSSQGALGGWYRTILGEPIESDHVYGYWAFIVGALFGLIGLLVFLYSATLDPSLGELGDGPSWDLRGAAGAVAMFGGALIFLSVVLLLPLEQTATKVALVGAAICVIAIAAFVWAYPSNWYWAGADPDYSPIVMSVYALGILIMIGTAFVFPLATDGEDPLDRAATAVSEATEGEAIGTAPTESKATFEVYQDRADEWRWRLRHDNGNIIADSGEGYASRQKAKQGLQSVKTNAAGAGEETLETATDADTADDKDSARETSTAASASEAQPAEDAAGEQTAESKATFEIYEDKGGKHRWRLRHQNGNIIADSGQGYASERSRDDAVDRLKRVLPDADTLDYEPAAYEIYKDNADEWRWRLRHKNGNILADGGEGYASRSNARKGIESVRRLSEDEDAFEVYEDQGGKHRWRLEAENGELVADSSQGYASKSGARDAVERIVEYAREADTLDYEPAAFELYQDNADEWRWRLRHKNGQIIADGSEGYSSKQKARQGIQSVLNNGPGADVVEQA